jgi:hypothetical protein
LSGPGAGELCWVQAIREYYSRAAALSDPQRAGSLTINLYNCRVALALDYIAQLICIPHSLKKAEYGVLQRLFHLLQPPSPKLFFHVMDILKFPQPFSIQALSAGARYRAATNQYSVAVLSFPLRCCDPRSSFQPIVGFTPYCGYPSLSLVRISS